MGPRRSPIRLRTRDLWPRHRYTFGNRVGARRLVGDWTVSDEAAIRLAVFRNRRRPEFYAILHRSPKRSNAWQLTRFDEEGPMGDATGDAGESATSVLQRGLDYGRNWKLESIVSIDGTVVGKAVP